MSRPPATDRFPPYPHSWYLFCRSRDLRGKPLSRDVLGRRLVAFRTAGGRVAVLDAICSHLGADLGNGRVVGEVVRCPFHHWEYGADGVCTRLPGRAAVPGFARQRSYPVTERHGYVFFFNGREPLFPLPFFWGERPEEFVASRPLCFEGECEWPMIPANGFDFQHFRAVHDRELIGEPAVDCPHPLARRSRFAARVTGRSLCDRLLRRVAGPRVDVSITNWGGPFVVVTGFFGRARSHLILALQPRPDGTTHVDTLLFTRRRRPRLVGAWLDPLSLWVRRLFTRQFMRKDFEQLAGIRYRPHTLVAADRDLAGYFRWVAALPRDGDPENPHGTGNGTACPHLVNQGG